jgi:Na+-driven multidrug efflux pump
VLLPCIALGLSPFIMQSTESILAISFNTSLLKYGGDLAVGSMTILSSVMQLSMLPLVGLTQGATPIISFTMEQVMVRGLRKHFCYYLRYL